jgi:hypothetical protein
MVEPESQVQKSEGGPIDWTVADVRLGKFALWYLVVQFAIDWIVYFVLSSNVEISRSVHSLFVEMDHVTPALALLKGFYHAPVNGREFSQVFAIYFSLLALFCLYLIGLCGLLLSRKFRNLQWRKMFARNDVLLVLILVPPVGFWEIYFFFVGPPSLRNYLGLFGTDFIASVCLLLPTGQFMILGTLALYYSIGEFQARNASS